MPNRYMITCRRQVKFHKRDKQCWISWWQRTSWNSKFSNLCGSLPIVNMRTVLRNAYEMFCGKNSSGQVRSLCERHLKKRCQKSTDGRSVKVNGSAARRSLQRQPLRLSVAAPPVQSRSVVAPPDEAQRVAAPPNSFCQLYRCSSNIPFLGCE